MHVYIYTGAKEGSEASDFLFLADRRCAGRRWGLWLETRVQSHYILFVVCSSGITFVQSLYIIMMVLVGARGSMPSFHEAILSPSRLFVKLGKKQRGAH